LNIFNLNYKVQLLESGGGTRALANLPLIDMIYPAGIGKLILLSECTAILYDTTTRWTNSFVNINKRLEK